MAIDPKLVSIKTAGELPVSDPSENANFLFYEGETLQRSPMSNIYDKVTSGIKGTATPTSSPTAWTTGDPYLYESWKVTQAGTYTNFGGIVVTQGEIDSNIVTLDVTNGVAVKTLSPTSSGKNIGSITPSTTFPATGNIWGFANAGTYPNAGGLVVADGNLGVLSRVAGVWSVLEVPVEVENKINNWTGATLSGGQRLHNGQMWTAKENTLEDDEPGVSDKWEPEIDKISQQYFNDQKDLLIDYASGKPVDYKITPLLKSRTYINSVGNQATTISAISSTEDFIDLKGATSVFYSGRFGDNATRIAFYSGPNIASLVATYPLVNEVITSREYPTPEGAKYVRATCYDSAIADFYLILLGINVNKEESLFDFRISGSSIVYENSVIKEADIVWNDGSTGRVIYSDWDESNATYKGFTATSIQNNKQIVQPSITFDKDGKITNIF